MDAEQKQTLFNQAKEWTIEAGERIKKRVQQPFEVNTKRDRKDLVTEVDEDTEKFFAERIRRSYPEHQVLGEEGFGDEVTSLDGIVWIIDPIDGTMNFVHQKRNFAISVAIYEDGEGIIGLIYNVMTGDLYSAKNGEGAYKNNYLLPKLNQTRKLEDSLIGVNQFWAVPNRRLDESGVHQLIRKVRGTRSYGSAALEFAFVSEGIMDAYLTMRLSPWDIAAGVIIVNEVGGLATRVDGNPLDMLHENTVITCNPSIHKEIIENYIHLKE
ncbi:myo-inositol-1(or 4)-monophosphatase [Salinibacillus kushneri]|uniref:inositol-phosphate phosphatase n=1 Tax=Salinibacillus kushneri TaxID=237682 RepID=A0A1I0HRF0_9BACI|nr:inositol monophosphatase [Salinibacillus kushneri]SET86579.1 myo-inositol-1(or 4)-monophosphatase [Salinibacillus kushneri]